jgi:hypothetical protein
MNLARLKQLIRDDWRAACRHWSLWLGAAGATLTSYLIAFPDAALYAWGMLPPDLKALIPAQYTPLIGCVIFVASLVAKFLRQVKLEGGADGRQG